MAAGLGSEAASSTPTRWGLPPPPGEQLVLCPSASDPGRFDTPGNRNHNHNLQPRHFPICRTGLEEAEQVNVFYQPQSTRCQRVTSVIFIIPLCSLREGWGEGVSFKTFHPERKELRIPEPLEGTAGTRHPRTSLERRKDAAGGQGLSQDAPLARSTRLSPSDKEIKTREEQSPAPGS